MHTTGDPTCQRIPATTMFMELSHHCLLKKGAVGQWLKLDRLNFKLVKKYNTPNYLTLGKAFTTLINLKSQPSKNSCYHLFCMFIRIPHQKYSG